MHTSWSFAHLKKNVRVYISTECMRQGKGMCRPILTNCFEDVLVWQLGRAWGSYHATLTVLVPAQVSQQQSDHDAAWGLVQKSHITSLSVSVCLWLVVGVDGVCAVCLSVCHPLTRGMSGWGVCMPARMRMHISDIVCWPVHLSARLRRHVVMYVLVHAWSCAARSRDRQSVVRAYALACIITAYNVLPGPFTHC